MRATYTFQFSSLPGADAVTKIQALGDSLAGQGVLVDRSSIHFNVFSHVLRASATLPEGTDPNGIGQSVARSLSNLTGVGVQFIEVTFTTEDKPLFLGGLVPMPLLVIIGIFLVGTLIALFVGAFT